MIELLTSPEAWAALLTLTALEIVLGIDNVIFLSVIVSRIPPVRVGGGVFWRDANWLMRVNLLHAFAQNDIAVIGETPTAGYNLLKAEISYKTKLDPSYFGAREMTVGLVGNNLLNENIRNSVSYNKDEVLMPGIGVRDTAWYSVLDDEWPAVRAGLLARLGR